MAESFRSPPDIGHPLGSRDRRLVHLSARLASATTRVHLEGALGLMADELDASIAALSAWHPERDALETVAESGPSTGESVFSIADYPLTARVLEAQEAVQVFVGDPAADPREVELLLRLGERSLLMVPVVAGGRSLGMLEIYRLTERPWSARRDQPRAGDCEPVCVGDRRVRELRPRRRQAAQTLERAAGAELAPHRFRAAPHLNDLGPALLDVADDQLAGDPLLVEQRQGPLHGLGSGRVPEAVGNVDPPVPVGPRVRLGVDLGHQHRCVDVQVLVGDPQVADDVGPVAR